MFGRVIGQKNENISFNESPDEEDFNYTWNLDLSSDEDNLLRPKSEVLWSRELLHYPDSFQSFSDLSGRTLSSCSWHNDDFDMKSTSKVNASLEAIENALYEKIKLPYINETVFQECCDWAEKFPYFRIKGEQIVNKPSDSSFILQSVLLENVKQFNLRNSSASLHLEGKKLPLHTTSKPKGICFDNANEDKIPVCLDDINGDHIYEEYLVLHKSDVSEENIQLPNIEHSKSHSSAKILQEKVIDKLVQEMWPNVLSFLEKMCVKSHNVSDFQLPPIIVANEQKKSLNLQRPRTEGAGIINTEFPKLENILSVSPKILQKRAFRNGCLSYFTRPNSEMSLNHRMSSKSVKSVFHNSTTNTINTNTDSLFTKETENSEKEPENLYLVLPALEEDFQDSSSILRGFHIEPEKKEPSHAKSLLPSRNENEALSTARDSEYFLPPIEDKNYIPSNMKLTKNLFTFYGSSVISDDKRSGSAKYKKQISRPNTSVSKKTTKSYEVTRQFSVNNGLYITARNINKTSSNSCTDQNVEPLLCENEPDTDASPENSVTLFPIVTSLTPHEDKNHGIKKGLRTFLGGRKR